MILISGPTGVRLVTSRSVFLGLVFAGLAIALRLLIPVHVAGQQAVFSFPAIVLATLLFGTVAGAVAALICLLALWYFVLPASHSFAITSAQSAITLAVYAIVAIALVAAIGTMRVALAQYRLICQSLENKVELRTAERNRVWERSTELMVILSTELAIKTANPAFIRALGGKAVWPGSFKDLLDREGARELDQACARLTAPDRATSFEARLRARGGDRQIDWNLVDDEGWFYLIGRDVTDIRECEERLVRLSS